MKKINRGAYVDMYGPTTGDRKIFGFNKKVMGQL